MLQRPKVSTAVEKVIKQWSCTLFMSFKKKKRVSTSSILYTKYLWWMCESSHRFWLGEPKTGFSRVFFLNFIFGERHVVSCFSHLELVFPASIKHCFQFCWFSAPYLWPFVLLTALESSWERACTQSFCWLRANASKVNFRCLASFNVVNASILTPQGTRQDSTFKKYKNELIFSKCKW